MESLLEWLDPATIDRYGVDQCRSYLEGVVGFIGNLRVPDGRPDVGWLYDLDGTATEVPDTWEIDVELEIPDGDPTTVPLHFRLGEDGVTWFTDCGTPTV